MLAGEIRGQIDLIARFQRGGRHHLGSIMPWQPFAMMTTDDLGALYEFLHRLTPAEGPTGDGPFRREAD